MVVLYSDLNFVMEALMNKSENTSEKSAKENIKFTRTVMNAKRSRVSSSYVDSKQSVKVVFLGGLNQIGKNMTAIEVGQDIILIDCGTAFPDGITMLGVDLVIPDFSYVEANKDRIKALIVTHGHEDHIGAVPYLLKKVNMPVYGTPLTIGLITSKLREHKLMGSSKLFRFRAGQSFELGSFKVEFIHVNHSIPDAVALSISTPIGKIIHTGDFKIDCTPAKGQMIDLPRLASLGKENILLLMADSTNADRPGYTKSEFCINEAFENLFRKAGEKRIIIATFASNIGRIQQIIDCAVKYDRKVMFSGRSMINYVSIAMDLNYINAPEGIIVDIDSLGKYSNKDIVLVTTGSQGEPMSALYKMAFSEHRRIEVGSNDFIIISAHPIPGNEKMVNSVVNELMRLGCEVIYESMYEVHVSGHACQEELKMIHSLLRPRYFIPVHGECKHMRAHANLSKQVGTLDSNILIADTGDIVEVSLSGIKKVGQTSHELIMVDGAGVGDVGSVVLNDRKHLGEDGIIVVVAAIRLREKKLLAGPDIFSRGFVYVKESEELMISAKKLGIKTILSCYEHPACDWNFIKSQCRDVMYKFFHDRTRRKPVILPIIMEVR